MAEEYNDIAVHDSKSEDFFDLENELSTTSAVDYQLGQCDQFKVCVIYYLESEIIIHIVCLDQ
jgi:hypothetical protein